MAETLTQIAQKLKDSPKKVQLIYAFNGTGKTRLSREFKELIAPKDEEAETGSKILYYNAFTEDLFYWENDLEGDSEPKLKIQANAFTPWIFEDQGHDQNVIANFQRYTNDKLTPRFNQEYTFKDENDRSVVVKAYSEVTFSFERGNGEHDHNIKISKGEESNFVWSIFYTLIEEVVSELNKPELEYDESNPFHNLEYIFIDDPVSSLDENHLIELAVNLSHLIKLNQSNIKFIITTHNPLFYNVLFNELNNKDSEMGYKPKLEKHRLIKKEDATFELVQQVNDSPFSYHLFLKDELKKAIETGQIHKYHFNFLRNLLEKTSTFLGYSKWGDLLNLVDGDRNAYEKRIINFSSHSKHSAEEVPDITEDDKRVLRHLVTEISRIYQFKNQTEN